MQIFSLNPLLSQCKLIDLQNFFARNYPEKYRINLATFKDGEGSTRIFVYEEIVNDFLIFF